jgi:hypothetical protein
MVAAAVAEEVSMGAWERPPGVAAVAVEPSVQQRVAAQAEEAPAGARVLAAALQASAVAQPQAAVALWASAAEVLRRAAAEPDAPAERRQAELPSAAPSCPCPRARLAPAQAPSARSVPVKARLRIASP